MNKKREEEEQEEEEEANTFTCTASLHGTRNPSRVCSSSGYSAVMIRRAVLSKMNARHQRWLRQRTLLPLFMVTGKGCFRSAEREGGNFCGFAILRVRVSVCVRMNLCTPVCGAPRPKSVMLLLWRNKMQLAQFLLRTSSSCI